MLGTDGGADRKAEPKRGSPDLDHLPHGQPVPAVPERVLDVHIQPGEPGIAVRDRGEGEGHAGDRPGVPVDVDRPDQTGPIEANRAHVDFVDTRASPGEADLRGVDEPVVVMALGATPDRVPHASHFVSLSHPDGVPEVVDRDGEVVHVISDPRGQPLVEAPAYDRLRDVVGRLPDDAKCDLIRPHQTLLPLDIREQVDVSLRVDLEVPEGAVGERLMPGPHGRPDDLHRAVVVPLRRGFGHILRRQDGWAPEQHGQGRKPSACGSHEAHGRERGGVSGLDGHVEENTARGAARSGAERAGERAPSARRAPPGRLLPSPRRDPLVAGSSTRRRSSPRSSACAGGRG